MTNLEFQEVGLVFPDLTAQDIDVRVERIVENNNGAGLTLLLYKDARVDMRMLDEVVGALNWQREHTIIDGVNFCTVSIRSGHDWVKKMDAGKAGQFEKEKGAASDAFKRACFTNEQVISIRSDERSNAEIAREYGVSKVAIRDIKRRKNYKEL